jgi:hypothetical protein
MPCIPGRPSVLSGILVLLFATSPVAAQDDAFTDLVRGRGLTESQQRRSGLLGRTYTDARYLMLQADDMLLDDPFTGAQGSLNTPVNALPGESGWLNVDAFFNWLTVSAEDSVWLGPGAGSLSFDTSATVFGAGMTLYCDHFDGVRPFVQVGWEHVVSQFAFATTLGSMSEKTRDDNLLLNLGLEVDLTESLALRAELDPELEDDFETSLFSADLIQWLGQHAFLRAGYVTDLTADVNGFSAGAGLAW